MVIICRMQLEWSSASLEVAVLIIRVSLQPLAALLRRHQAFHQAPHLRTTTAAHRSSAYQPSALFRWGMAMAIARVLPSMQVALPARGGGSSQRGLHALLWSTACTASEPRARRPQSSRQPPSCARMHGTWTRFEALPWYLCMCCLVLVLVGLHADGPMGVEHQGHLCTAAARNAHTAGGGSAWQAWRRPFWESVFSITHGMPTHLTKEHIP